jgi:hypothetical protein
MAKSCDTIFAKISFRDTKFAKFCFSIHYSMLEIVNYSTQCLETSARNFLTRNLITQRILFDTISIFPGWPVPAMYHACQPLEKRRLKFYQNEQRKVVYCITFCNVLCKKINCLVDLSHYSPVKINKSEDAEYFILSKNIVL